MFFKLFLFLFIVLIVNVKAAHEGVPNNPAFDPQFYKDQLNPQLCAEQLEYINSDLFLRFQFLESGPRIPRSIHTGNTLDLGLYYQCIGINEDIESSVVEGKYCMIEVPLDSNFELPGIPDWIGSLPDWIDNLPDWIDSLPDWIRPQPEWMEFDPRKLRMSKKIRDQRQAEFANAETVRRGVAMLDANRLSDVSLPNVNFRLAVCVPKTCTVQEGLDGLLFNLTDSGFSYEEEFCRTKNDKPWAPADYVAIVVFSLIGFLTLLSTSYDLWHLFILKTNPKSMSTICRSFSLYNNTKRLLNFQKNPSAIECLDGIRSLAMMWVIVGHSFVTLPPYVNLLDGFHWLTSLSSLWITAGPISVDTFFMLSGLLLVYTTCGKLTSTKLLKNLHMFYLNRLLRMFPLLAAVILVQASIFHRVADGPLWQSVAQSTDACRSYWWTTLLYIQNYVNEHGICQGHTWYLAIDIQLHIISPIILFWVLSGNRKSAWIALTAALLAILTSSTAYNFVHGFPAATMTTNDPEVSSNYMQKYYMNTLTRASPFFVGMIYGYLLHLWRNIKMEMSKLPVQNGSEFHETEIGGSLWTRPLSKDKLLLEKLIGAVALLWICALSLTTLTFYANHPIKLLTWDSPVLDGLINSFMRPGWALGLGLIILLCVHGYAGPINWFLSLEMWKLPSRLSYGMYLFHFPMQFVINGTVLAPIYFSPIDTVYMFVGHFAIALMVSFLVTLTIDSPFSTLIKLALGGQKPQKTAEKNSDLMRHNINDVITANGMKKENLYTEKL